MIDTNIIISAALFRSGEIAGMLEEVVRRYKICICTFSIEEIELVVARKFSHKAGQIDNFLREISYELIYTPKDIETAKLPYVRDDKDYPILAAALYADVDVLLTGDKDLLTVVTGRPEILDSKRFRAEYL